MLINLSSLLFAVALFFVNLFSASLRRLHYVYPESLKPRFFKGNSHALFFATLTAQSFIRFATAALFAFSAFSLPSPWSYALLVFSLIFFFGLLECLPRILANLYPEKSLEKSRTIASFFILATRPFSYLLQNYLGALSLEEPMQKAEQEIIELIRSAELSPDLSLHDKKLIESVLTFKERIAREIMVPRVNVFSLPCTTTIKEAARLIDSEGYSRIPLYRNTVDNIVGVLLYKDITRKYMEYEQKGNDPAILDAAVETIQKSVLYTPETKKISNLLLEFRKKQSHLAIVVDEYGGTEGIVTIEDILEEIVGEIADEYDEEEDLFIGQADGSFLVDARMNILDVEEQLGVEIPQEGEYDTIGGFIFHAAGSIPPKGFEIHQDTFELQVLRSDERRVQKVRIKPIKRK